MKSIANNAMQPGYIVVETLTRLCKCIHPPFIHMPALPSKRQTLSITWTTMQWAPLIWLMNNDMLRNCWCFFSPYQLLLLGNEYLIRRSGVRSYVRQLVTLSIIQHVNKANMTKMGEKVANIHSFTINSRGNYSSNSSNSVRCRVRKTLSEWRSSSISYGQVCFHMII